MNHYLVKEMIVFALELRKSVNNLRIANTSEEIAEMCKRVMQNSYHLDHLAYALGQTAGAVFYRKYREIKEERNEIGRV